MKREATSDLTRGPVGAHVRRMGPPAVGSVAILVGFEVVDAFWAGRMTPSTPPLAALAVGTYVLWSISALSQTIQTGGVSMMSNAIGAGREDRARRLGAQALILSVLIGLLTAALAMVAGPIAAFTEVEGPAYEMAREYLVWLLCGGLVLYAYQAVEATFRSWGDTRTPMIIIAVALVLNAIIDPWLIFGGYGIPALGLPGAAIATIATRLIALVVGIVILVRRRLIAFPRLEEMRGLRLCLRMARIGAAPGLGGLLYTFTFMVLARRLEQIDEDSLAAFMVGQKAESISWALLVGLGIVAGAYVGQNLGAGSKERAYAGAWFMAKIGCAVGLACSLLFCLAPEMLISAFAPGNESILEYGRVYLFIIALSQVFLALEIVLEMAILGSGDTVPPMLIVSSLTLMRIPLAYALAEPFGAAGVFWSITLSTFVKGAIMCWWFRRRLWIDRGMAITAAAD